jgi:ribonuclease/clavin/mitogillin
VTQIVPAASVLLTRGAETRDVFLVRRAATLKFFGGFWAFPGGKVDPADANTPLSRPDSGDPLLPRRITAARELFEETGILLARRGDGTIPATLPDFESLRRAVLEEESTFADVLERLCLSVWADDFTPIGSVTTPPFVPSRFDTTFFLAHQPADQHAHVQLGELDQGEWATPSAMLARWQRGEVLVSPPSVMTLQLLEGRPVSEAPARVGPMLRSLAKGKIHPIYFAPDVQLIPLRTIALPPSSHTNTYLVGRDPAYLLDPGPDEPAEQQRLFDVLDDARAEGKRLAAIVLTHHHPDHVGAVRACASRYQVPIWAHPLTGHALPELSIGRILNDGDKLDLGTRPDGIGNWHLEALHTPGHAPGHLAFFEPSYRLLIAGDMVSTLSSIVIAPPDGDLRVYLNSLQRLLALNSRLLLPAHGNVTARPRETIEEGLAHRAKREEQLLAALRPEARSIPDLAGELYRGLPADLMLFAELQTLAGLRKLEHEGRAQREQESWRVRTTSVA